MIDTRKNIDQIIRLAQFNEEKHTQISTNFVYGERKDIKVTVIITLYNYEKLIGRCMLSAAGQDMESFEIIVVDDASTDSSVHVVSNLMDSMAIPIMLIRKSLNTGVAHSRNIGIIKARGDYVFTLDADNYLATECIKKLYQTISKKKAAAAFCTIEQVNENNETIGFVSNRPYRLKKLLNGTFYIDAMAMFDLSVLMEVGMYSTELLKHGIGWEDFELWVRLGIAGHRIVHLDKKLAFYYVHDRSMLSETRLYHDSLKLFLNQRYGTKIR